MEDPADDTSHDHLQDLQAVLGISRAMSAERDLDRLLDLIVNAATELIAADRSSLFLVDREAGELWTRIAQGSRTIRVPIGLGIAGTVAAGAEPINIPDAYRDERFNPENDRQTGYQTKSILCMPLVNHEEEVVGVIQVLNKGGGAAFDGYDEQLLAALCANAAVAIDTAQLIQRDLERQALEREMQLANRIQQSLLPSSLPELAGWRFAVWQQPCDQTGGDYHDFLLPDGDGLDLVVGDVSGHGIGAALLMSTARAFLRGLHGQVEQLPVLMGRLNNLLEEDMADDVFMTMLITRLHADGSCSYVSAGHDPPQIFRRATGACESLEETGLLLGAIADCAYATVRVPPLQTGDLLVTFTDGVFEASSPAGEEFGLERVRKLIVRHHAMGAEGLRDALIERVFAHLAGAVPQDDITLLVAERR